jgi:putative hydrolase of the HAD superfamily
MSVIKYLLFDIDGVLIDGFHHDVRYRKVWSENIEDDLGIDRELFEKHFFQEKFKEVLCGDVCVLDALHDVLNELGLSIDPQTVLEYWLTHDSELNTSVIDFIHELKTKNASLYIGIASNQEHYRAEYIWNELGFSEIFDSFFFSAKLGCIKEDATFFKKIIHKLQATKADEILLVDDSPKVIQTAEKLGMQTFLFKEFKESIKDLKRLLG